MREDTRRRVTVALSPLVGVELSAARRAADMLTLHFGPLRQSGKGSVGDHALHVQCAWRIDGPDGIVTGRAELWEPVDVERRYAEDFDYDDEPNLRDVRVRNWLAAGPHVVEDVEADDFGGAAIHFGGGFALRMFPMATRTEDWRIFGPGDDDSHFVVTGGKIEDD